MQARPWPLAIVSLAVMIALLAPAFALRLDESDAGNDPANLSSRHAFDLLAQGFGQGFNGPLLLVAELPAAAIRRRRSRRCAPRSRATPDVVAVTQPQIAPSGTVAVMKAYPDSAPQALATTNLVNQPAPATCCRRSSADPACPCWSAGSPPARSTSPTCSSSKLPLFFAIVILLSALLLLVMFRSLVIPAAGGAS